MIFSLAIGDLIADISSSVSSFFDDDDDDDDDDLGMEAELGDERYDEMGSEEGRGEESDWIASEK